MKNSLAFRISLCLILAVALTFGAFAAFAETTKITMASWQWEEAGFSDFYRAVAKQFHEAYPQYEIEEVSLPYAQYWDKMTADCAADCPPDIMMHNASRLGAFVQMGEIEVLENFMDEETESRLREQFSASQSEPPVYVDGKTYAIYMMMATHQLMYNKALLDEAGVAVPTTPDEFLEAAKTLTKLPGQYGYGFMTAAEDAFTGDIYIWVIGFEPDVFKDGKFNFNTPNVIEALTYYKAMFDAGVSPIGTPKATYRSMFAEGQVAFLIDGPWQYTFVESLNEEVAKNVCTAVVPFPTQKSQMAENIMTIPADAKNKEGAWLYMQMCTTAAAQAEFAEYTNCTPGMASAITEEWLIENPWFQGFVDGADGATICASLSWETINAQIRKIVLDRCQEILYANADITETVAKIQQEVDALAAEAGLM
jgi:multiple sugar transport system substrate-binding protein